MAPPCLLILTWTSRPVSVKTQQCRRQQHQQECWRALSGVPQRCTGLQFVFYRCVPSYRSPGHVMRHPGMPETTGSVNSCKPCFLITHMPAERLFCSTKRLHTRSKTLAGVLPIANRWLPSFFAGSHQYIHPDHRA